MQRDNSNIAGKGLDVNTRDEPIAWLAKGAFSDIIYIGKPKRQFSHETEFTIVDETAVYQLVSHKAARMI